MGVALSSKSLQRVLCLTLQPGPPKSHQKMWLMEPLNSVFCLNYIGHGTNNGNGWPRGSQTWLHSLLPLRDSLTRCLEHAGLDDLIEWGGIRGASYRWEDQCRRRLTSHCFKHCSTSEVAGCKPAESS